MASSSNDDGVGGNEARDAKILEFQEICAVDDQSVAVSFLERFDWDLQVRKFASFHFIWKFS